jgi:hypothetical protein
LGSWQQQDNTEKAARTSAGVGGVFIFYGRKIQGDWNRQIEEVDPGVAPKTREA